MPEAPAKAPPETPAAPAQTTPDAPVAKMQPRVYSLKFDPAEDFSETTLFVKGCVRGTIWISQTMKIAMRSLLSEEGDKINEEVKVKADTTISAYQSEITYWNLAYAIEAIGGEPFSGTLPEKIKKLRGMATAVLMRMAMAYLEFNGHVDDLFRGKEALDLAKKS